MEIVRERDRVKLMGGDINELIKGHVESTLNRSVHKVRLLTHLGRENVHIIGAASVELKFPDEEGDSTVRTSHLPVVLTSDERNAIQKAVGTFGNWHNDYPLMANILTELLIRSKVTE